MYNAIIFISNSMSKNLKTRDETRVVVKSNYLIEASYRLSLKEQRLILLTIIVQIMLVNQEREIQDGYIM